MDGVLGSVKTELNDEEMELLKKMAAKKDIPPEGRIVREYGSTGAGGRNAELFSSFQEEQAWFEEYGGYYPGCF